MITKIALPKKNWPFVKIEIFNNSNCSNGELINIFVFTEKLIKLEPIEDDKNIDCFSNSCLFIN